MPQAPEPDDPVAAALSCLLEDRHADAARLAAQAAPNTCDLIECHAQAECDELPAARRLLDTILFRDATTGRRGGPEAALYRGIVLFAEGDLPAARAALDSALPTYGDPVPSAIAAHYLGQAALGLGDLDGALSASRQAAELAGTAGTTGLLHNAEVLHARALLQAARLDAARDQAQRVLQGACLPPRVRCAAHGVVARVQALRGDRDAARGEMAQATAAISAADPAHRIAHELELAELELLCGGPCAVLAERAARYYAARGRRYQEARAQGVLAAVLLGDGGAEDLSAAAEALARLQDLGTLHGYGPLLMYGHVVEAALLKRRGEERRARALVLRELADSSEESLELHLLRAAMGSVCDGALPGQRALLARLGLGTERRYEILDEAGCREAGQAEVQRAAAEHRLVVDLLHGSIRSGDRCIAGRHLTCSLLARLVEGRGQVISAECLFREVWGGRDYHPLRHRNTIYVAITRLRRLLRELLPDCDLLETAPSGWRLAMTGGADVCVIRSKAYGPSPANSRRSSENTAVSVKAPAK